MTFGDFIGDTWAPGSKLVRCFLFYLSAPNSHHPSHQGNSGAGGVQVCMGRREVNVSRTAGSIYGEWRIKH